MQIKTPIKRQALLQDTRLFLGAPDSPLLAPRGVYLTDGKLIVADTGQNRVFVWNRIPERPHQAPDLVLGQRSTSDTGRNAAGEVDAGSLMYPSGLWSDGQRLIIADAWNHRVLIWQEFPTRHGQPADVVLGQPDFEQNQPNVEGIAASPTAQSLYWPYGLCSDGRHLWIADTGNRRVLFFQEIPTQSYSPADRVIGKPGFNVRDYDNRDAIWPYSVKVQPEGALAITDTQYYRVLLWRDWQTAFEQPADVIIGQADFEQNGQNQFGWFPAAGTLNWCYDSCFYQDGLWVADTGNSRILWFDQLPQHNNRPADNLLGQDNFETGSENKNTIQSTEGSLYWPFHISIDGRHMAIADTGNHRIVLNTLI